MEDSEPIDPYDAIRKRYGYDDMSGDEQRIFDERLEQATRKMRIEQNEFGHDATFDPNRIEQPLENEQVEYHRRRMQ